MFKKIASLVGAGAMLLSVAGPAFGVNMTINKAKIKSTTNVSANTGDNIVGNYASVQKAHVSGEVKVKGANQVNTGEAEAKNLKVIAANINVGCDTCGDPGMTINKAKVKSTTDVYANTGANNVGNTAIVEKAGVSGDVKVSGDNTVDTGKAEAGNKEIIVVNAQLSW